MEEIIKFLLFNFTLNKISYLDGKDEFFWEGEV